MTRPSRLIAFASPRDPHVKSVMSILQREGIECLIFSPISDEEADKLPTVSLADPSAIDAEYGRDVWWLRNKHKTLAFASADDQRRELEMKTREDFMKSLIAASGARSFNNIGRARCDKLWQLRTARELGAAVPETLIGGSQAAITAFVADHDEVIMKPFSTSFVPGREGKPASLVSIMTSLVSTEEIASADPASMASVPAIYQKYVEKKYELRIIAFAEQCVAFRIHSQRSSKSRVDWRRGTGTPGLFDEEPVEIPRYIQAFMSEFLKRSLLDSGVFDFAVRPDGSYVFFECNPSGQWADVDKGNGLVSHMFADGFGDMIRSACQRREEKS